MDQNLTAILSFTQNEQSDSSDIFVKDSNHMLTYIVPIDMQFNAGHVLSISVYTVLCVFSAAGNLTVLTTILKRKQRQNFLSRVDKLLLNLAIADLLVTFFMMPLEIVWAATVQWKGGDVMCRVMAFLRIFGLYLSGFLLVCLGIDRYWAVRYPLQGMASTKRAKWMICSAWILSCLCSFPQVIIFHVESHPIHTWFTQCVTFNTFPEPIYEISYNIFVMTMMYVLPFLIIIVLYGLIVMELRENGKASKGSLRSSDGLRRSGVDRIQKAKVKSIKMASVISAAFLLCWTPYYFMCIWYWANPETAQAVDQRIQKGLFLYACTNSAVNPIVYGWFHNKTSFGRRNLRQTHEMSVYLTNRRSTHLSYIHCRNSLIPTTVLHKMEHGESV